MLIVVVTNKPNAYSGLPFYFWGRSGGRKPVPTTL